MLPWAETRRSNSRKETPPPTSNTEVDVVKKEEVEEEVDSFDLKANTINSKDHLGLVKFLLTQVVTFGFDIECDKVLVEGLGIRKRLEKEECYSGILRLVKLSRCLFISSASFSKVLISF